MTDGIRVSSKWTDREDIIRAQLRGYRSLVSKHTACQQLYDTLFPRTTSRLTDEPRGGQVEMFEIESIVQQRMDLSDVMQSSLQQMRAESNRIMAMLKPLPDNEYTVILRRYMIAESWEEIAKEMHYCRAQVWNIHDRAIRRIEEYTRQE